MTSRPRILVTVFALLITASSLAGCSFEPGERTQLVGQECFVDEECVEGAVCVERSCRYEASPGQRRDTDHPDANIDVGDVPPDALDVPPDDVAVRDIGVEDGGEACRTGVPLRCVSDTQVAVCNAAGTGFDTRTCDDRLRCEDAECVPFDPRTCEFQNQPCIEEGPNNGYFCAETGGDDGPMRCLGACDISADNPDATCPDAGSVCVFGNGRDGVCMTGCTIGESCATPGYGCLPADGNTSEGICSPTNSANRVGDRCDDDTPFDCEEGALCLEGPNGARCVEACRSFSGGAGTDCSSGHCVPLTATIGICRPDAGNRTEGEQCRQRQIYQACGEDAVICTPNDGWQRPECVRACRIQEGNIDCNTGQRCVQYDEQGDELGVCINSTP